VALLILLPESVAAISAARKNDLQKSINWRSAHRWRPSADHSGGRRRRLRAGQAIVLGSIFRIWCCWIDVFLSMLTFGTGRTNILFGLVHLCICRLCILVFVP